MRTKITFLLSGLVTGLACVLPGPRLSLLTLTWGVGPAFFVAVLVGLVITGARRDVETRVLRYLVVFVGCFITYLLSLLVFFAVGGFSLDWFGFRPSSNFDQFGVEVVIGLFAAASVAAIGIAQFANVLTGKWSSSLLVRLMLAGVVTILVTYAVNRAFRNYWSFYGVLIPLGMSLFSCLVGTHVREHTFGRQLSGMTHGANQPFAAE